MQKAIFITGPSASGKSTVSRRLARDIGFSWLDTGSVIRMTALVMEHAGVRLPGSYEEALDTPCPPWKLMRMDKPGEIPISVGGQLLDYDEPLLRSPKYDTNTMFLARALRSRTWSLLEDVATSQQAVISARRVPTTLLQSEAILPIYLDLSSEKRAERRASYEQRQVDPDLLARVVGKENQNIGVGNLVSPEEASDNSYILVKNEGTLDRSVAQLLLEVVRKYEGFTPVDYDLSVNRLQDTPAELRHYSRWADLVRSLNVNNHPEGYSRNNERR